MKQNIESIRKHLGRLDVFDTGVQEEIVKIKESQNGDLYFIRVGMLDKVDVNRMQSFIHRQNAHKMPLWELMSTITMGNGLNALEYFHQYVFVKAVNGAVFPADTTKRGAPIVHKNNLKENEKKKEQESADSQNDQIADLRKQLEYMQAMQIKSAQAQEISQPPAPAPAPSAPDENVEEKSTKNTKNTKESSKKNNKKK